jgi:eukaryotic-like serine/threonine-protein kinase
VTEIGDVLAGKYRVLAELGAGGMGCVYRAENTLTGKQVALKCLHPHLTAGADSSERLLREARAVASLTHSNVVDVYDIVKDGETLFLVMELLKGETLRAYLQRNPQPKISEFLALLLPAMSGVEAAHQSGVIHRDLKPENIFLAQIGGMKQAVIKVLDFGIAKLAVARGSTLTRTGAALGTPLYMSLEQLRGDKDIDQRADVYAFGVMLYEAVTGLMPYDAETLPELAIKVATTDAPPVKSLRSDIPTALARIIDWAVARDRKARLPNLQTLQQELELFAHDRTFREHMTERNAPFPRLAAEPSDERALPTPPTAASRDAPRAPKPSPRPEADTLRAGEIARRSRAGTSSWLRSRWVVGGAVLASGLVAGSLWLQSPAEEPTAIEAPSLRDSPPAKAAELIPAVEERKSPAPAARPAPLPAPGGEANGATQLPLPTAANSSSAPATQELELSPESVKQKVTPGSEQAAPKVTPPAALKNASPVRVAAPAAATQKRIVEPPVVTKPPAAQAAPAKKDARELVGF